MEASRVGDEKGSRLIAGKGNKTWPASGVLLRDHKPTRIAESNPPSIYHFNYEITTSRILPMEVKTNTDLINLFTQPRLATVFFFFSWAWEFWQGADLRTTMIVNN